MSSFATAGADEPHHDEPPTTPTHKTRITKQLLCIRHGISVANERMTGDNEWGASTFRDEASLIDAPLSQEGWRTTQQNLSRQLGEYQDFVSSKDFVVCVSPLTRCLQTHQASGLENRLLCEEEGDTPQTNKDNTSPSPNNQRVPVVLAVPLLRERVYTASDTGRPVADLSKEFPNVNFDECHDDCWWYHDESFDPNDVNPSGKEWRPFGQGQWYAVAGEPDDVFESRMNELEEWIRRRPEPSLVLVAHWGVFHHLTNGTEWNNAEAKLVEWTCTIDDETDMIYTTRTRILTAS